jgi:hypothetical protein
MPRINYQLTLENYQEMTANRLKALFHVIALWVALAGLGLILGGYFYLRVPPPDDLSIIGGIMLASGLLAEFIAMLMGILNKPKQKAKVSDVELQREYSQYAADPRLVEYDQTGFRVKWYDGEDIRPWAAVRGLQELKTLLVISTITTHYWLPKAALEQEGHLAELKALACGALDGKEVLFTVPIRPTAFVYLMASLFHYWRRNLRTRCLLYIGATLATYWTLSGDWWRGESHSALMVLLVPFILLFCESLYFLYRYYSAPWTESAHEARIMEDRIGYQTQKARITHEYRLLHEWREIPGTFMLYFSSNQFHFIPKHGFTHSQIEQFRGLLQAHFSVART